MAEAENLRTIAEVGIAIAGFTGVVVALGRRSEGHWATPWDLVRLRLLLSRALGATLFSFAPSLLMGAGLSAAASWRVGNACLALFGLALLVFLGRSRVQHAGDAPRQKPLGIVLLSSSLAIYAAQLWHAAGGFPESGSFLYLLCLTYVPAMAGFNFSTLLFSTSDWKAA